MTLFKFFSGKGGVGKTTMASATALHYAINGKKTLIVTTDPASNLADVFEQKIGHKVTLMNVGERCNVPLNAPQLYAMEIDPEQAARDYKENIIGPLRGTMPDDVIASLEENLSGPCTTEMASFDRFMDFMGTDDYDMIVFDTAPTGHTIRLLELPVDWSRHIQDASQGSGQTCLGPVQSIQDSKDKYDRATALLRDKSRTDFIFVMRPESLSLYETMRASNELESIGITSGHIIINGILPEEVCINGFFRKKFLCHQEIIREADEKLKKPARYMMLKDNEISGINALQKVAEELFDKKASTIPSSDRTDKTDIIDELSGNTNFSSIHSDIGHMILPEKETKAIFFTGKGGVGKTTISCITALSSAQKGVRTLIVTTDPAAHIGEVYGIKIGSRPAEIADNLFAVMIDQEEASREYKKNIMDEARGKYSDDMMAALEEELNSPCTDEMASFDKFIQFIECSEYSTIIFDTAPTGHTLRLLDLPFDYARQAELKVPVEAASEVNKESRNRFKKIIELLRNKSLTVFCTVLYPESTPVLESYRAMIDLKDAGIETQFIVANMVLPEEVCINNFFKNRRKMQLHYLDTIKEKFNLPVLAFPLMDDEIKGFERLKAAAGIL
jgi:arsenite-transporting ATPase